MFLFFFKRDAPPQPRAQQVEARGNINLRVCSFKQTYFFMALTVLKIRKDRTLFL